MMKTFPVVLWAFMGGTALIPIGGVTFMGIRIYQEWLKAKALRLSPFDVGEYGTVLANVDTGQKSVVAHREIFAIETELEQEDTQVSTPIGTSPEDVILAQFQREEISEQIAVHHYTPPQVPLEVNAQLSEVLVEREKVAADTMTAKDYSRIETIKRLHARNISTDNICRILGMSQQQKKFKELCSAAGIDPMEGNSGQ
jgi:hypothetical protein